MSVILINLIKQVLVSNSYDICLSSFCLQIIIIMIIITIMMIIIIINSSIWFRLSVFNWSITWHNQNDQLLYKDDFLKNIFIYLSSLIIWHLRNPRTAMDFSVFCALLSCDNDLLSGYLDMTKVVFLQ